MLNGIDPIILFNFKMKPPGALTSLLSKIMSMDESSFIDMPPIPIYLSERLTGIYIDSESKNVDVDTNIETLTSGDTPQTNQRAIGNTVRIEMVASRDSIGVSLFSALTDLIVPKVTSKEYSITYLHGAVTVFNGLLHAFSITQNANNDLYNITLELAKPAPQKGNIVTVARNTGALPL